MLSVVLFCSSVVFLVFLGMLGRPREAKGTDNDTNKNVTKGVNNNVTNNN